MEPGYIWSHYSTINQIFEKIKTNFDARDYIAATNKKKKKINELGENLLQATNKNKTLGDADWNGVQLLKSKKGYLRLTRGKCKSPVWAMAYL